MNAATTVTVEDLADDVECLRGLAQECDDMLASVETVENVSDAFGELRDVMVKAQELADACAKVLKANKQKTR